ncbi:hypothetical protein H4R18_004507 [Coemansia javaensis]|uniref:CYRIA/CYRIB Rac1 binding domain-containing protein n=1 Tax=Coemansia javaensis TaxID=2761396 RepID=A0A9W8H4P5_9FUNG|nr:hypothetical protein H4R18_004507 [Coemansia javaensis]
MGSLLSLLRGGSASGNAAQLTRQSKDGQSPTRFSKQFNEFICNLGDTRSAECVEEGFPEGSRILRTGRELLGRVRGYQDGSNEVRLAISQPTPENEEAAWRKIGPSVALLRECYEFAQDVERIIPGILGELCSGGGGGGGGDRDAGRADRNRMLARLLADLMQNAFAFDVLKSSTPAIQNDFSYYRRTLGRISKCADPEIARFSMGHDVSNQMSLFYAYHNPMVKTVIDAATRCAQESDGAAAVVDCLAALAAGSLGAVKHGRADGAASERMCVLVLVTSCVLYDWIAAGGLGDARSAIDAKAVLAAVGERPLVEGTAADKVLRANCRTLR